jgi:hypothetical protein
MPTQRLRVGTIALGIVLVAAGVGIFLIQPSRFLGLWLLVAASMLLAGVFLALVAIFSTTKTPRPLVQAVTLESPLSASEVLDRLALYVAEAEGSLSDRSDGKLEAAFGSQLAMRMMGVVTQYGVDRLPYRLHAEVSDTPGGTRVDLAFSSDEGRYLGNRAKVVERAYSARFNYVTAVLRSRLS